jgi:hypothetical protein
VRALRGGIPRALPSHKTREGWAYRRLIEATRSRLPSLPAAAAPMLREAALATLDLARLRGDLEVLRARRGPGVRRQEERRLRSEIRKTRVQMLLLDRRLDELASSGNGHAAEPGPTPAEILDRELAEAEERG